MISYLLISLAALAVVFILVVARRPAGFRVVRRAAVSAPPEVVFAQVNDLHHYQTWSPWAKQEPTAKIVFEGPSAGIGATFAWVGRKLGAGRMTVTESRPGELVRFRLEFLKPFRATNTAEFTFQPEAGDGDRTVVTWSMAGTNNLLFKAFGLFMDCDRMIGGEFEKGLADLKTLCEQEVAREEMTAAR